MIVLWVEFHNILCKRIDLIVWLKNNNNWAVERGEYHEKFKIFANVYMCMLGSYQNAFVQKKQFLELMYQ